MTALSTSAATVPASFTIAREQGSHTVAFTDTSVIPGLAIHTWSWDFGDGSTSNEQNPIHKFQKAGTYAVTLTVEHGKPGKPCPHTVTQEIDVPLKKK